MTPYNHIRKAVQQAEENHINEIARLAERVNPYYRVTKTVKAREGHIAIPGEILERHPTDQYAHLGLQLGGKCFLPEDVEGRVEAVSTSDLILELTGESHRQAEAFLSGEQFSRSIVPDPGLVFQSLVKKLALHEARKKLEVIAHKNYLKTVMRKEIRFSVPRCEGEEIKAQVLFNNTVVCTGTYEGGSELKQTRPLPQGNSWSIVGIERTDDETVTVTIERD